MEEELVVMFLEKINSHVCVQTAHAFALSVVKMATPNVKVSLSFERFSIKHVISLAKTSNIHFC